MGSEDVPIITRVWRTGERVPYKKTYQLRPGECWLDAEETPNQNEYYVLTDDGIQIPVGVQIARDLLEEGATTALLVEMWGGVVLLDASLYCIKCDGEVGQILARAKKANGGSLGGFPDVVGIFPDGMIALREAKYIGSKDQLSPNQHKMADALRREFGNKLDIKVVEWRSETNSI